MPVLEFLSYKVTGLRPTTLLKERFGHKCFPVDFMELLLYRTPPVVASGSYRKLNKNGGSFFKKILLHFADISHAVSRKICVFVF